MIICRQLPVIQQTPSWFLPLFQPGNVVLLMLSLLAVSRVNNLTEFLRTDIALR